MTETTVRASPALAEGRIGSGGVQLLLVPGPDSVQDGQIVGGSEVGIGPFEGPKAPLGIQEGDLGIDPVGQRDAVRAFLRRGQGKAREGHEPRVHVHAPHSTVLETVFDLIGLKLDPGKAGGIDELPEGQEGAHDARAHFAVIVIGEGEGNAGRAEVNGAPLFDEESLQLVGGGQRGENAHHELFRRVGSRGSHEAASMPDESCVFLASTPRLPYNRGSMEGPPHYHEQLDAAIETRRQLLESERIPLLKNALESFEALFEGAIGMLIRKGLLREDPYNYEQAFSDIAIPKDDVLPEFENSDEVSYRLAAYRRQLKYVSTEYALELPTLNLARLKKLSALISFINWLELGESTKSPTTRAFARVFMKVRMGADSMASQILKDSEVQIVKTTHLIRADQV